MPHWRLRPPPLLLLLSLLPGGLAQEVWCENFDNPTDNIGLTAFRSVSVASNAAWNIEEMPEDSGRKGAIANGFGADVASDLWLVSRRLRVKAGAALTFDVYHKFHGSPPLELKVSGTYGGLGSPDLAQWDSFPIAESAAEVSDDRWAPVRMQLSSYAGRDVHLAFRYQAQGVIGGQASRQGVDSVCLSGAPLAAAAFCENFANPQDDILRTRFIPFSVAGSTKWAIEEQPGDSGIKGAVANGFGADEASDDWLFSPLLAVQSSSVLFFNVLHRYSGSPALELKVSANYDGVAPPSAASWVTFQINESLADSSDDQWAPVRVPLGSFAATPIHFAFRYQSTGTAGGEAARMGVTAVCLSPAGEPFQPQCEPFANPSDDIRLSGWTQRQVASDAAWAIEEQPGESGLKGAIANGFGASGAADTWLVSGWVEVWDQQSMLTFEVYNKFSGSPALELKVSRLYSGSGPPSAVAWDTIAIPESLTGEEDAWTPARIPLASYAGSRVWLAFRYQSQGPGAGEAARMGVDNVCLSRARSLGPPFCERFENAEDDIKSTTFRPLSVASDVGWGIEERPSDSGVKAAIANGFGGDVPSDDWLVSPKIAVRSGAVLSFSVYHKFSGSPPLELKVSRNWSGTSLPSGAAWDTTEIAESLAGEDDTWHPVSMPLDPYAGSDVHIAFRYQSSGTAAGEAARLGVDEVCLAHARPLLCEDFANELDDLAQTIFTQCSVASNVGWGIEESPSDSGIKGAIANGYDGDEPSDDWLISPPLRVVSPSARVSFAVYSKYSGSPALDFKVSDNYHEDVTPLMATWTSSPIQESLEELDGTWKGVARDLSAHLGRLIRVAWRYRSTGTLGGEAARMGIRSVCFDGVESSGAAAADAVPPAPPAPELCEGCVRLLVQFRTELQPVDRYDIPCPDVRKADCGGGALSTLAWARHWHVPNRTFFAYGLDSRSRLVLFHPLLLRVNLITQELFNASMAIMSEPHAVAQQMKKQMMLHLARDSIAAGAPIAATNLAFDTEAFQVFTGMIRADVVLASDDRRVGVIVVFGSQSFVSTIAHTTAVPAAALRLRQGYGCDTVVVLCTRFAFPHKNESELMAHFDVDFVLPFQCPDPEEECGVPPPPYIINGTWFLPRPYDLTDLTYLDLPRPGTGTPSAGAVGTRKQAPPEAFRRLPQWETDSSVVQALVDEAARYDPVVGYSTAVMPSGEQGAGKGGVADGPRTDPCRREECPAGNLAADALRWTMEGVELAIINGGSAQDGGWPPGNITASQVYTVFPHANTLCMFRTTAAEIYRAIEENVARVRSDGSYDANVPNRGGFPQVSGMRYTFDPSLPPLHRVTRLQVLDPETGEYHDLDRRRHYSVGTLSFLCSGGDGYTIEKVPGSWRNFPETTLQSALINYLSSHSPYTPGKSGRIELVFGSDPGDALAIVPLGPDDCTERQRYLPDWADCEDCPPGTWSPTGVSDCIAESSSSPVPWFIWVIIAVGVSFLFLPVAWKLTANRRRINSLYNNNRVAEETAQAVAELRLEDVNWLFDLSSPNRIQAAFMDIVTTLREVRSYLPSDIVDEAKRTNRHHSQQLSAAIAPEGRIAIVFTDIVQSTQLWEADPHLMDLALELHNNIMRAEFAQWSGYEVKTIGDAFMCSFSSSVNACACFAAVQENLLKETWPDEDDILGRMPSYATAVDTQGRPIFKGLRVRIGINVGECRHEKNPLTERTDYKGHVVNTASRVEGAAAPGMVCITNDVLEDIRSHLPEIGKGAVVKPWGQKQLKGVVQPVALHYIVTDALRPREAYWLEFKAEQAKAEAQRLKSVGNLKTRPRRSLTGGGGSPRARASMMRERSQQHVTLGLKRVSNPLVRNQSDDLSVGTSRGSDDSVDWTGSMLGADANQQKRDKVGGERFSRHVTTVSGSAVCVRLPFNQDGTDMDLVNASVETSAAAAGMTKGRLGGISGEGLMIFWNITTECPSHRAQCLTFLVQLPDKLAAQGTKHCGDPSRLNLGVGGCSGSIMFGRVGGRQRFPVQVGYSPALAVACSEACMFFGAAAMLVQLGRQQIGNQAVLRPVDRWRLPDGSVCVVEDVSNFVGDDVTRWDLEEMYNRRVSCAPDYEPTESARADGRWVELLRPATEGDAAALAELSTLAEDRIARLVYTLLVAHAEKHIGNSWRVDAPIFSAAVHNLLQGDGGTVSPRNGPAPMSGRLSASLEDAPVGMVETPSEDKQSDQVQGDNALVYPMENTSAQQLGS